MVDRKGRRNLDRHRTPDDRRRLGGSCERGGEMFTGGGYGAESYARAYPDLAARVERDGDECRMNRPAPIESLPPGRDKDR